MGQSVEEGEILVELDGVEIRSELASVEAKLSQATQRRAAALSRRDASSAELERLEIQHLRKEMTRLTEQESELLVRVTDQRSCRDREFGTTRRAPLKRGETLFEIAPLERVVAEIDVPDREIAFVRSGMTANVLFDGDVDGWKKVPIDRIHPRSELRADQNVFVAEAELPNEQQTLRPGMGGTARVIVGHRSVAWLLFNKPLFRLRQLAGW